MLAARLLLWLLCLLVSYEFFNDLYHRFLLTPKTAMKCMCLQAMSVVYGRCYDEIGAFNDTRYIIGMLDRVSQLFKCIVCSLFHIDFDFPVKGHVSFGPKALSSLFLYLGCFCYDIFFKAKRDSICA